MNRTIGKYQSYAPKDFINADVNHILNVVRACFKDPEFIDTYYVPLAIDMIYRASQGYEQTIWALERKNWRDFYQAFERILVKVQFDRLLWTAG